MSWKHLGTSGFGRLIEANDDLAALLARRCAEADDFEAVPDGPGAVRRLLPAPAGGRDAAMALAPDALDAHQDRLQRALELSGDGWLTTTRLRGATYLRAGIVNFLSTEDDIDRLLDTLRSLGRLTLPDRGPRQADGGSSGAGRSQVDSIATLACVAAAVSVASSTSSAWNASAPDARGDRPSRIAAIMSASPMPRPTLPSNRSGTSVQSSVAELPQPDRPVEVVRVAEAERALRAVDLDVRRRAGRDVERRGEPADRPRREPVDRDGVGRDLGDERLAGPRPGADPPLRAGAARLGRHRRDRAEQADQRRDVVRTDVQQRTAARAVEEVRVRVPALGSRVHDRGVRPDRLADRALVDERAGRLQAAAEERVRARRATTTPAAAPSARIAAASARVVANGFSE